MKIITIPKEINVKPTKPPATIANSCHGIWSEVEASRTGGITPAPSVTCFASFFGGVNELFLFTLLGKQRAHTVECIVTIDDAHSSINLDSLCYIALASRHAAQSDKGRVMMFAPLFDLTYTS
jgi:hypothetical protein